MQENAQLCSLVQVPIGTGFELYCGPAKNDGDEAIRGAFNDVLKVHLRVLRTFPVLGYDLLRGPL